MADFSEDQVDLCLGAMVQDVAEDNISPSESEGAMAAEQFGQVEAAQGEEEEADANAEQPADDFAADQPADDFTAEQSAQDATSGVEAELAEPLSGSTEMDATDATDTPSQDDKAAATLSKELRKLQAESAVLQEHSRRLQEKAAEIQQKRTSIDQGKQVTEGFRRQASEQSEAGSLQYGVEGDREASYQYSSDTSLPRQDGGLQWSIGGVPVQQQLRMLAVDNGMGMEEQAAGQGRSSEGSDVAQGLQWGPGAGTAPASPTKKKSSSGRKAAKEEQAGSINSVGALHDARSKQVSLNPLRTRKSGVGQAANPVIRQQSISQQAQAKQGRNFADTLRKPSQHQGGAGAELPQAQSPDPQQEPFYPNRALADVYSSSLVSSKSEPNGLYAKGTPKGGYPISALAGPPKAASVHEMDMSPSPPGATKRRSKAVHSPTSAPGPYSQTWGHSAVPFMGMAGGPGMQPGMMQTGQGMMGGMYNPQPMAGLPHLAPQQMGPNMMGGYGPPMAAPQQAYGNMYLAQGPVQGKGGRRNPGMTRQAGSALKVPAGNPMMMGGQPMQQGAFPDAYGQNYGGSPMGTIPAYPMQYAQNGAAMGQPHMMTGQYGALPPVGYPTMPHAMQTGVHGSMQMGSLGSMHSSSRQHKKGRAPGGQTNYMQQGGTQYAAALPMAQAAGLHPQGMQGMSYPAMQQRADAVQQFQMQQYQQMEASVMQQLQQKQDHALLKYGNFDSAQYRQQDMQSRPEFRTY